MQSFVEPVREYPSQPPGSWLNTFAFFGVHETEAWFKNIGAAKVAREVSSDSAGVVGVHVNVLRWDV